MESGQVAPLVGTITSPHSGSPLPWILSAATKEELAGRAERLHEHLTDHPQLGILDIGHSLAIGGEHLRRRAAILRSDREGFLRIRLDVRQVRLDGVGDAGVDTLGARDLKPVPTHDPW